jgi:Sensors of blue-light using FAD
MHATHGHPATAGMTQLTRLVYVSRSASAMPKNSRTTVEPAAGKILMQARANNRISGLTGVLCFGDGYFFQCLEGEGNAIDELVLKLKGDARHCDLTVLSRKPIETRSFERWEMKFVAVQCPMMKWLESLGYERFDPYQFDGQMIDRVLNFLGSADDSLSCQGATGGPAHLSDSAGANHSQAARN